VRRGSPRPEPVRRGIFGGSFDPVHNGHLIVAASAAEQLGLDRVHFVLANRQPLKDHEGHRAPAEDRWSMVVQAVEGDPRFCADDREVRRGGISYTADTVEEMRREFANDWLCLLVGTDTIEALPQWRGPERIARALDQIVVLTRTATGQVPASRFGRVVTVPEVPISATLVRAKVARGESIDAFVPPGVAAYIQRHGLYREEE